MKLFLATAVNACVSIVLGVIVACVFNVAGHPILAWIACPMVIVGYSIIWLGSLLDERIE